MDCKYLKLVNGDNIIVQTDSTTSDLTTKDNISIVDPVQITSMRIPRGVFVVESYIMQPWLKVAKNDVITLPTRNIMVVAEVNDMVKEQYKIYLQENLDSPLKPVRQDVDGFAENRDEAFDEFFQMLNDDQEEDDNDDEPITRNGSTLH